MSEENKTPLTINGVEYFLEDFSNAQMMLLEHIKDLDGKMSRAKFELDQLSVAKDSFIRLLEDSLKEGANPEE